MTYDKTTSRAEFTELCEYQHHDRGFNGGSRPFIEQTEKRKPRDFGEELSLGVAAKNDSKIPPGIGLQCIVRIVSLAVRRTPLPMSGVSAQETPAAFVQRREPEVPCSIRPLCQGFDAGTKVYAPVNMPGLIPFQMSSEGLAYRNVTCREGTAARSLLCRDSA